MLDLSNLHAYFRELWKLSRAATQFQWNPDAVNYCAELADELKRMLELMEKNGHKEAAFEYFCREMLAEYSPDNAAYYVNPDCSRNSAVRKNAWPFYSVLMSMELDCKPLGVTQAALTVCAAMGVACDKTLTILNAESMGKLPSPPPFGLDYPVKLLLTKMKPEDRRVMLHVVSTR